MSRDNFVGAAFSDEEFQKLERLVADLQARGAYSCSKCSVIRYLVMQARADLFVIEGVSLQGQKKQKPGPKRNTCQ